jgi:protein-tyrosine sulfotransferase
MNRSALQGGAVRPVLLVGAARSGTTLLRLLLDAHGEIGCPAEVGIPSLIQQLGRAWWMLLAEHAGSGQAWPDGSPQAELPTDVKERIRRAVLEPMSWYCEPGGKRIYCDKSLDSVHHLEAVRQIFPEAQYVLLFRHAMDTVASGIEASPWGFHAYGYGPFVQSSPGNFVAALTNYWLSHVDRALAWEAEHPELCHRVRYEDLVAEPEETLAGIFEFLGVAVEVDIPGREHVFVRAATATGPGDYKVAHTSKVHAASVGRGKRVPVSMIPPSLLEALNAKLGALGYEQLGPSWNAEPRAGILRNGGSVGARLVAMMGAVRIERAQDGTLGAFAVVAEDDSELRWVIDPAARVVRQGDGEVESVLIGTAKDLASMISGEENPGVLFRSGRVRHLCADSERSSEELVEAINGTLALLSTACTERSAAGGGDDAGGRARPSARAPA